MKKRWFAPLMAAALMASALPAMAAEQVYTAIPSQNPLYVGQKLVEDIPVYMLEDNNYFRLRDIAMLMDFSVEWDAAGNCVNIRTDQPYGDAKDELGAATQDKPAVPSAQKVYIDGTEAAALAAYSIDGYNYFRLRDLAEAADFGCVYDADKHAVVLDAGYSYQPDNTFGPAKQQEQSPAMALNTDLLAIDVGGTYQMEVSNAPGIVQWKVKDHKIVTVDEQGLVTGLAAGNTTIYAISGEQLAQCEVVVLEPERQAQLLLTEQQVYNSIMALQAQYPEGMAWTNDNGYFSEPLNTIGYGCHAFALICSDAIFGTLPGTIHKDFDSIRVGDIVRIGNYHTVIVLEKREDSVVVVEGNYNSAIHWGREITREDLEQVGFYVETRYPD